MILTSRFLVLCTLVLGLQANAKSSICARMLQTVKQAWPQKNSGWLQENISIHRQHLAKASRSDEELIRRWLLREENSGVESRPFPQTDAKDLLSVRMDLVRSIPGWKSLINAELRSLVEMGSYFILVSESDGLAALVEDYELGKFSEDTVDLWNANFTSRAIVS